MRIFSILLTLTCMFNGAFSQSYTTESKVEILEGHTWYPGKILEVKEDKYKIHYDMYTNSVWDIWIGKDRLRLAAANQNTNQAKAISKSSVSGKGTLYSGSSGYGENVYYYMFPSGQIVSGCPAGGLENFNYNTYCGGRSNDCGVYSKNGNSFTITWNSGNVLKGKIMANGDIDINGSLIAPVKMIPGKLSGSYDFTFNTSKISVAETTKFKEDGTYEVAKVSGYDHNDGKYSAESQSSLKGRYTINGYTITLTDNNGKVSKYTIYALDATKEPDFLGWDGKFLSRK